MNRWVEIEFDCLPLRSIGRFDIPLDASPVYQAKCERIKQAIDQHGSHNSYYLTPGLAWQHELLSSVSFFMIPISLNFAITKDLIMIRKGVQLPLP